MVAPPGWLVALGSTIVVSEGTAIVRAPPELVWKHIGDPRAICAWDPGVLSMEPLDEASQRVGSRFRVRTLVGSGKRINEHIEELVAFEPLRIRTVRCSQKFMVFEVTSEIQMQGELTLCTHRSRVELFGHRRLIARVVQKFGDRNVRSVLRALKFRLSEEHSPIIAEHPGIARHREGVSLS